MTKQTFEIFYDLDSNLRGLRVPGYFFSLEEAFEECRKLGIDNNYKIVCHEHKRYTVVEETA